ncbi:hypothetical protein ABPG73_021972 [Tetrahymena malaccensis]
MQIILDNIKILSKFIDQIDEQIQQFQKNNNQNKISEKDLIEDFDTLTLKINQITNKIKSAKNDAQDFRNQEQFIHTKTEHDGQKENNNVSHFEQLTEGIQNIYQCQSPSFETHTQVCIEQIAQTLQNKILKTKPKKSVSFSNELQKLQEQTESSAEPNQNEQIKFKKVQSDPGLRFKIPEQPTEKIFQKSILKKSKTLEKQSYEQECCFYDDLSLTDLNLDYYGIKNHQAILNLTQKEQKYENYSESIFFSELAVKLSNSGQSQQRIICLTQNYFYVLPNLNSSQDVKRFLITEINEMILDIDDSQTCSLVIKNQFKLNIKLNHRKQFIQFILGVSKNKPNVYFKNSRHLFNSQHYNNSNSKFFNEESPKQPKDNKQQFNIFILNNGINDMMNTEKINGKLLIDNDQIIISANDSNQFIIEKGEMVIFQKNDIQNRTVTFQSSNNHSKIFDIQLQNEYDYPLLENKLVTYNKYQNLK